MAIDLGELGRFQPVRKRGPTHPVAGAARGRSGDRAVPRLSAGVLARERHTGAPSEDRGDVPRSQPEPGPGDERFVRGEPPRDVAPRRTGGRSRRHAAELHGELGPRADVRRSVKPLRLQESRNWQFDPDELSSLVTAKTKAIAICNPNNPTGAVMGQAQRKAVLDAARDRGAWLLSDEVYIGAEREGPRTESVR